VFNHLEEIHRRPAPFEFYAAADLWTDEYASKQMLSYRLNGEADISGRRLSFIDRSAEWITERFELRAGQSVADFGCGPGLYPERPAKSRAAVTGIDFYTNSIECARQKAERESLNIRHVH
jgi:2-polyprenyl-3-methyl-5-hydroxy-6-metoxy-1,4-benzoquinol methylase